MGSTIQKALAGAEDLLIGAGTVSQTRNGSAVVVSKLNALNIPYSGDESTNDFVSIKDALDDISLLDFAYLGAHATDPLLDNNGNALADGAIYWNTTDKYWSFYDLATTAWYSQSGVTSTNAITFTNKTLDDFTNDIAANTEHIQVYNTQGSGIEKGSPVYTSGWNSADIVEVKLADADTVGSYPAIALVKDANIGNSVAGGAIVSGMLQDMNTGTANPIQETGSPNWVVGDSLYLSGDIGKLTSVRPTGSATAVQSLAKVLRVHVSQGVLLVQGAGRVNDVPNTIASASIGANSITDFAGTGSPNIITGLTALNSTAGSTVVFPAAPTSSNEPQSLYTGETVKFAKVQTDEITNKANTAGPTFAKGIVAKDSTGANVQVVPFGNSSDEPQALGTGAKPSFLPPTIASHVAIKSYVDSAAIQPVSPSVAQKLGTGDNPIFASPTASGHAAIKSYVDATTFVPSTFLDQGTLFSRASENTLHIPDLGGVVDGTLVKVAATTKALNTAANWDDAGYATPAYRAGKDFYVYLLKAGGVILSHNSTVPTGSVYTSANSRKIAGFHCLCVAVGSISGHDLDGMFAGDILPRSVWDRFNRPVSSPEGMVLSKDGMWVDIYLPSWDSAGVKLVSIQQTAVNRVSTGVDDAQAGTSLFHCYKFEQLFGEIGKKLIRQTEFVVASLGSNQGTQIAGSYSPSNRPKTGGNSDTAGRRMISNIGCEDMAGAYWQWSRDPGGSVTSGAAYADAFDANDSGVGGQHYHAPYRAELGGSWSDGSGCGSRASAWSGSPLYLYSSISARSCAEPASNRI